MVLIDKINFTFVFSYDQVLFATLIVLIDKINFTFDSWWFIRVCAHIIIEAPGIHVTYIVNRQFLLYFIRI